MNILELRKAKELGRKIAMLTCYDFCTARILNASPVDILLVGDSGVTVMHGFSDTIPATLELMVPMVAAVRRGAPDKFIVGDMPFLSFRSDMASNIRSVQALMQAGANAIKLEGFDGNGELVRHLTQSGVPVMGHIGLTPQSLHALGGFRVQGRGDVAGRKLLAEAHGLEETGCFAVVLECVPGPLASEISAGLKIPTIGIGAGKGCDGQVLVLHDMLGLNVGFKPKFLRQYLDGAALVRQAVETYCADVAAGKFPAESETYE